MRLRSALTMHRICRFVAPRVRNCANSRVRPSTERYMMFRIASPAASSTTSATPKSTVTSSRSLVTPSDTSSANAAFTARMAAKLNKKAAPKTIKPASKFRRPSLRKLAQASFLMARSVLFSKGSAIFSPPFHNAPILDTHDAIGKLSDLAVVGDHHQRLVEGGAHAAEQTHDIGAGVAV